MSIIERKVINLKQKKLILAVFLNYKKAQINSIIASNNDENIFYEEEELLYRILIQKRKPARITGYIVDVVNHYDTIQFQQNFRLKLVTFERLFQLISQKLSENTAGGRPPKDIRHQLLAVIWLLATPDSYRSVGERFDMSKGVLSNCFVRVTNILNSLIGQYIKWPTGVELETAKLKFASNSIFKNLVGVVDGTYVALSVSKNNSVAYTNRKCFTSMTLQAICDADMRYIDVYAGWPSSVPDIRIFKNSSIYRAAEENIMAYFPNNEYILGDKAYPILNWCITPFMNRGRLSQREIEFNKKHSSCRQVIERSFALLFGRFRRLKHLDMHRTDWAAATITACCVLHNVCLDYDEDVVCDYIREGLPVQTINSTNEGQLPSGEQFVVTNNGILKRNVICNQISL